MSEFHLSNDQIKIKLKNPDLSRLCNGWLFHGYVCELSPTRETLINAKKTIDASFVFSFTEQKQGISGIKLMNSCYVSMNSSILCREYLALAL